MRLIAIILLLLLSGCQTVWYSTVSNERPADWPELRVVEHWVSNAEFKDRCAGVASLLASIEACVLPYDFAKGECHIVMSRDYPPGSYVLNYERNGRCKGYDNPGSTWARDQWMAYKLHQRDAALWEEFRKQRRAW